MELGKTMFYPSELSCALLEKLQAIASHPFGVPLREYDEGVQLLLRARCVVVEIRPSDVVVLVSNKGKDVLKEYQRPALPYRD